ncbi:MAG: four helix bundle protein [bacterium]
MTRDEFRRRTKTLALEVIRLADTLPRGRATDVIARQLLRSATSVGANYCAACRYRSAADMVAKLSIVLEEADETHFWLELLRDGGFVPARVVTPLLAETNEIVAMTVASIKTLRERLRRQSQLGNQ